MNNEQTSQTQPVIPAKKQEKIIFVLLGRKFFVFLFIISTAILLGTLISNLVEEYIYLDPASTIFIFIFTYIYSLTLETNIKKGLLSFNLLLSIMLISYYALFQTFAIMLILLLLQKKFKLL